MVFEVLPLLLVLLLHVDVHFLHLYFFLDILVVQLEDFRLQSFGILNELDCFVEVVFELVDEIVEPLNLLPLLQNDALHPFLPHPQVVYD